MMFGRAALRLRTGSRSMSQAVQNATASGEIQAYRPKVQVTRHMSPFNMPVVTPVSKFLKFNAERTVENASDW